MLQSAAGVIQPPNPASPSLPLTPYTAKSGNDGTFIFRNLPSGACKLAASRIVGLYTPEEYVQRGVLVRGVSFPLAQGQQLKDIKLEMAPAGAITGRVFDEFGKGVGHAAVPLRVHEGERPNIDLLVIAPRPPN
jgi:hypothetical protein